MSTSNPLLSRTSASRVCHHQSMASECVHLRSPL